MNFEQSPQNEAENTSFHKKEFTPDGGVIYVFDHVAVKIDNSGKNYKELPELMFGTFDEEPSSEALHQPEMKRDGIDMAYVAQCIHSVAKDSGVYEFWFYPYGEDVFPEHKDTREQARLRLFQRLGDITPAPNGFGYILKV